MLRRSVFRGEYGGQQGSTSGYARKLTLESLEDRRQLSVNISGVALASDTGASASDLYTSNPTITGTVNATNSFTIQVKDSVNGVIGNATVSGNTFTYNPIANDSALETWQGALDLSYRSIEYDAYGGVIGTGAWSDFDFTLDRVAPTTTGIEDVMTDENSGTTVDLTSVFSDGGTPTSQLTFAVSASDPSLLSSTSVSGLSLSLTPATNQWGSSEITVTSTDLAGNSTSTSFNLSVNWINSPPAITNFQVINGFNNVWTISGTVTDDEDPAGDEVDFGGCLTDYDVWAIVQEGGGFSATVSLPGLDSGMATAQTWDQQFAASNVAAYVLTTT